MTNTTRPGRSSSQASETSTNSRNLFEGRGDSSVNNILMEPRGDAASELDRLLFVISSACGATVLERHADHAVVRVREDAEPIVRALFGAGGLFHELRGVYVICLPSDPTGA